MRIVCLLMFNETKPAGDRFIERLSSRAMCTLSSDKPCCWGNMNVIELD